jgi:hypothetical protein
MVVGYKYVYMIIGRQTPNDVPKVRLHSSVMRRIEFSQLQYVHENTTHLLSKQFIESAFVDWDRIAQFPNA